MIHNNKAEHHLFDVPLFIFVLTVKKNAAKTINPMEVSIFTIPKSF